jgi:hypothetical protein
MPGESAEFSVEVPMAGGFATGHFVEVPPPEDVPIQDRAAELGLIPGLRVEASRHGQWRCCECGQMQRPGSDQVWVADGVRMGDEPWSVSESARAVAYNGGSSAWCMACAKKLGRKWKHIKARIADTSSGSKRGWFMRLLLGDRS